MFGNRDRLLYMHMQACINGLFSFFPIDHIAVVLYLLERVPSLSLHLPAKWVEEPHPHFHEAGGTDWKKNPGKTANAHHRQFSAKIKEDTLQQIQNAIYMGATHKVHDGFMERNSYVALSEYLIAFTWGEGDVPKKGGTHDTWTKCKMRKIHIPLRSLLPAHCELPVTPCGKRPTDMHGPIACSCDISVPFTKKHKEQSQSKDVQKNVV